METLLPCSLEELYGGVKKKMEISRNVCEASPYASGFLADTVFPRPSGHRPDEIVARRAGENKFLFVFSAFRMISSSFYTGHERLSRLFSCLYPNGTN